MVEVLDRFSGPGARSEQGRAPAPPAPPALPGCEGFAGSTRALLRPMTGGVGSTGVGSVGSVRRRSSVSAARKAVEEAAPLLSSPTLPALQPSYWVAPGGQRAPNLQLRRVCADDLQEAALRGDVELLRKLIDAGVSVNVPMRAVCDDEFLTLSHVLASRPDIPNGTRILSELIRCQANVNVRSSFGSTPLMLACLYKHTGAAEVLLSAGADAALADDFGRTAVRCAVILGQDDQGAKQLSMALIHLLANWNADLNNGGNVPAITEAVVQNNSTAVSTLLELGVVPDGLNEAVRDAPLPVIEELVRAKANPFKRDEDGKDSMELALARGSQEITTLLRDYIGELERSKHRYLETRELARRASRVGGDWGIASRVSRVDRRSVYPTGAKKASGETTRLQKLGKRCQHLSKRLIASNVFQVFSVINLVVALFLQDLWVVANASNDAALDSMVAIVLCGFIFEFILQIMALQKSYIWRSTFWMDLIGILSVPLDLSVVSKKFQDISEANSGTLTKLTKLVKLSARAGRITRLTKLLRFLPGTGQGQVKGTAKGISTALNNRLAIEVSVLIITMAIAFPLIDSFRPPEDDFSPEVWVRMLGKVANTFPEDVPAFINSFEDFYRQTDIFPFKLAYRLQNSTLVVQDLRQAPERQEDVMRFAWGEDGTYAMFNFRNPSRTDSICTMSLIVTVIGVLFVSAFWLSSSVSSIVLIPLEQLLGCVQNVAGNIFNSVEHMADSLIKEKSSHLLEEETDGNETHLLQKVLEKLTVLSEITSKKSPVEGLDQLGEGERGLLRDFAGETSSSRHSSLQLEAGVNLQEASPCRLSGMFSLRLEEADIKWDQFSQWDFDTVDLSDKQRHTLCTVLLSVFAGSMPTVDMNSLSAGASPIHINFIEAVARCYGDPHEVPYHNWSHAVDVAFTTYAALERTKASGFLLPHELFALVAAALSHDVGHPGVNNSFLVETSHELALRYNDHSPLENMHCARMFEIIAEPTCAIFAGLTREQFQQIRLVCVDSILATDNQRHFSLVTELQMAYQLKRQMLDTSAELYQANEANYPTLEVLEYFRTPELKRLHRVLFLHLADLSNPMKPWRLCKHWADVILEEFFLQGDKEKELGIPVQSLNDRVRVNRPFTQVSFLEFFVAPLAKIAERLMPAFAICGERVGDNLDRWVEAWLATKPDPAEQTKVMERITQLRNS